MTTKVFPEQIVLDTDVNLTANSDLRIPSQKAVKSYVDSNGVGLIQVIDVTTPVSSVTFSSIPQTYTPASYMRFIND